tara:strand:- start:169 stop:729 length:561 start_codon:yes stop_codon:yes gene_type:complete
MERKGIMPQVQVMADRLDLELVNMSIAGNGNHHIVYHTVNEILSNHSEYAFVCIGWSNPGRWDYNTNGNKWFAHKIIKFVDHINKDINIDQTMFMQWAPQVVMLTEFLRSYHMPFIQWNSLKTWQDGDTQLHSHIQSIPEFYKPTESHIEHLRTNRHYISEDDHHPDQQSHDDWADKLLDHYRKLI